MNLNEICCQSGVALNVLRGQDVAVGTGRAADCYAPDPVRSVPVHPMHGREGDSVSIDGGPVDLDLTAAPRQFAVVARRGHRPPVVVAWGQDFGAEGTLMRLQVPGTRIRQIFEHSSTDSALLTLRRLRLGTLALVWTAPTTEGI